MKVVIEIKTLEAAAALARAAKEIGDIAVPDFLEAIALAHGAPEAPAEARALPRTRPPLVASAVVAGADACMACGQALNMDSRSASMRKYALCRVHAARWSAHRVRYPKDTLEAWAVRQKSGVRMKRGEAKQKNP